MENNQISIDENLNILLLDTEERIGLSRRFMNVENLLNLGLF